MTDVDLLVLDDWPAARRVASGMGLQPTGRGDHAHAFLDPASQTAVELHHSLTSCPGFYRIEREAVWARAVTRPSAPAAPGSEDLLVHLCAHAAFQHGLTLSLVQFLDLRRVLEREPISPDRLSAVADEYRAASAVGAALLVAEAVVGAPLSPELRRRVAAGVPRGLAAWIEARLALDPLAFVAPRAASLARVRWKVARGRRWELLKRTLGPHEPGETHSGLAGALRVPLRGLSLLWRQRH
jgi:hypothetical protein